jgi:DNA-binding transcriptional MerR regulator
VQAVQLTYSVSEVARKLALSADWLREGERRGLLPPARRNINGHRVYTVADIDLLERMGVGQRPHRLKSAEEVVGSCERS